MSSNKSILAMLSVGWNKTNIVRFVKKAVRVEPRGSRDECEVWGPFRGAASQLGVWGAL